jgi:lysophospholipase L1-like esterase
MFSLSKWAKTIIAAISIVAVTLSLSAVFSQQIDVPKKADPTYAICLGDSITELSGYPEALQSLVGKELIVCNFGVSGSAVNLHSNRPYYYESKFREAKNFSASIVLLMLGTNDAHIDNCPKISSFTTDYKRIVSLIRNWTDAPIYLMIPPPLFDNYMDLDGDFLANEVIPRIYQIAADEGLTLIDLHTPLHNNPEYFLDGIHPNNAGTQAITRIVYNAIKDNC